MSKVKDNSDKLTEKQERYCQLRAQGYTKTKAASIAYDTKWPDRMGHDTERDPKVKERIRVLKEEREEAYGLDVDEQVRKYHELYLMAVENGNINAALKALERIDAVGGFETKKSEVTHKKPGDILKDTQGDLRKDIDHFGDLLKDHTAKTTPNGSNKVN